MLHSISSKKIAYELGVGFGLHQLIHQALSATGEGGDEIKSTVQTCNSRTSRPDIRLCLVVHAHGQHVKIIRQAHQLPE